MIDEHKYIIYTNAVRKWNISIIVYRQDGNTKAKQQHVITMYIQIDFIIYIYIYYTIKYTI